MMNQEELKQRLIELIDDSTEGHVENLCQPFGAESLADHLIANGVTIRERGEWQWDERFSDYTCSNCNNWDLKTPNYCSNCGADLRGAKDE